VFLHHKASCETRRAGCVRTVAGKIIAKDVFDIFRFSFASLFWCADRQQVSTVARGGVQGRRRH
jgi:hypothetical protein